MLKQWSRHIIEGNTYFGLEVFELGGREKFSWVEITRKKQELVIKQKAVLNTIDDVIGLTDKKSPLFVVLNTSKILKKQTIGLEAAQNQENLVTNAFPDIEISNFYYNILRNPHSGLMAICKKEYVDRYILQMQKMGLNICAVALGITTLEHIMEFLDGTITGTDFEAKISDNELTDYIPKEVMTGATYNINGLDVNSGQLVSFAHILGHIVGKKQATNMDRLNDGLANDFKNKRIFYLGSRGAIAFFLFLLLANFLFFHHYSNQNSVLEGDVSRYSLQKSSIEQLRERIADKEEKLKLLTSSNNSKSSFYLDEIGKELPPSISLSNLIYRPLAIPVRPNKPIITKTDIIQVSGSSHDKAVFPIWTEGLESLEWVAKVNILDYSYVSRSSTDFTIDIVLR